MTPHEGVLSYWVPYCFLRVVKYQQGQCFTSKEPVEVVFASTHRALAERVMKLEKAREDDLQGYDEVKALLQSQLADAQARLLLDDESQAQSNIVIGEPSYGRRSWKGYAQELSQQHAALRERVEALKRYVQHSDRCVENMIGSAFAGIQPKCECGLAQALATGAEG